MRAGTWGAASGLPVQVQEIVRTGEGGKTQVVPLITQRRQATYGQDHRAISVPLTMANDGQPRVPTDTQIGRSAHLRHRYGTPSKPVIYAANSDPGLSVVQSGGQRHGFCCPRLADLREQIRGARHGTGLAEQAIRGRLLCRDFPS